ncbi:hypothetical protein BVRB_3g049650 [Beta vulgaris subsp. vulgaris]|nr:hypothetical protein BVRB_3g049650 [Beta vulgaris subsp. vulgaris]
MAEKREKKLRISVGYALLPNKVESFIRSSLFTYAKDHGIDLILVDRHQSLLEQGPFDCLVHKFYDDEWNQQLHEFNSAHPHVPIIDSPAAIRRLHNRVSMLEAVKKLTLSKSSDTAGIAGSAPTVGIPKQILLTAECREERSGLKYPMIAKPMIANGTIKSHQMSLVLNSNGLEKVKHQAPVVLQEFVNHGGVLFKVYVAGNHVKCVHRKSLPDLHVTDHPIFKLEEDVLPFSQISNLPSIFDEEQEEQITMPPLDFIQNLAAAIRKATELNLFNFDLIRDTSDSDIGNKYLIIDINYLPGYAKLPGFEAMFTDFFWDVVQNNETVDQNLT